MTPKNFATTLGLIFSTAALNPAFAAPAENCNVVMQTIVDKNGVKHHKPIVACKDKKGAWEIRPIQNFMTVGEFGPNKEDQITTGYGVSDEGVVTTFFIDKKSKSVEVGTCISVTEDFRFWTASKNNVLILRELLTDAAAQGGRSEIYGNNLTTATLKAQNGAMMECILKGHIPTVKSEAKKAPAPEASPTPKPETELKRIPYGIDPSDSLPRKLGI
ncbi:MAG TPA: hypothetical protein PKI93_02170 [Alphaproteobacteria bacterium]|nr:hypothetical protein [Alphaproteobacteria bacterium]HNS44124.1 hypothetical protein [Alphaproteobacteria bacterium]